MDGFTYLGKMRHYYPQEDVYFILQKADGTRYIGGALGASDIKVTILLPDGSTKFKHTGTIPGGTLTDLGGGLYGLALYGEGQTVGTNDLDLAQVGRGGILVEDGSGLSHFQSVFGLFDVAADFEVSLAIASLPGSGGADQISGALSFSRWWTHERLTAPLLGTTAITSLALKVTDKDSASNILNLSGADFTENAFDHNVYFQKAIAGITGGRAITARVTGTYKGYAIQQDFLLQVPVSA